MRKSRTDFAKLGSSASFLVFAVALAAFSVTAKAQTLEAHDFAPWMSERDLTLDPQLLTEDDLAHRFLPERTPDYNKISSVSETTPSQISAASSLEAFYARRIAQPLNQFGYSLFENTDAQTPNQIYGIASGAVQDNVILGSGDRLEIITRGQRNTRQTYLVDRQGTLIADDLPPIIVSGMTLEQLRQRLALEAGNMVNTEIFVNLSELRSTSVLVVGQVKSPGRQILSAGQTVLDALIAAGGIDKSGSLRQIKLVRHGRTQIIDLYSLLLNGRGASDLGIREGDRIVIPPVGPTLAVAGDVKQPAIFELLSQINGLWQPEGDKAETLSLNDLLALSGGVISPSEYRFLHLQMTSNGTEEATEIKDPDARLFSDGSILMVSRRMETRTGTVELLGQARQTGLHSVAKSKTLRDLLPGPDVFERDIYPLFGIIEKWDKKTLSSFYTPFSPLKIMRGEENIALNEGDKVHLFSRNQINELKNNPLNKVNEIEPAAGSNIQEFGSSENNSVDPALESVMHDYSITVKGAVRHPGYYPISGDASLDDVISMAGGMKRNASRNDIEITSIVSPDGRVKNINSDILPHDIAIDDIRKNIFEDKAVRRNIDLAMINLENITLKAGDTLKVKEQDSQLTSNSIKIGGAVKYPGEYDLMPGDTYLTLMERAGGLTAQAYPQGTIFSRQSERIREEKRFKAKAREMEASLSAMLQAEDDFNAEEVRTVQGLIDELKNANAVGRITIEGEPAILQHDPNLDFLLEDGDRIFIPQRPTTVRVAGEVLSPAALFFRDEKSPNNYIDEAGGFTYHADTSRTFVVYPDGSAKPLRVSYWNQTADFIPPGSTIIVPRDPKPFDFMESVKDVSQILANLAITTALTEDLGED
ncbi:MAG: polysaccharide biosynthesis/export family protein [Alphaproteobacteria bacterium]|nr:polysaccharide biosynthesis/export family protein [Alphaproteobacteria bacterium]